MAKEEATAYVMVKAAGKFRHIRTKNMTLRHVSPSDVVKLLGETDEAFAQAVRDSRKK